MKQKRNVISLMCGSDTCNRLILGNHRCGLYCTVKFQLGLSCLPLKIKVELKQRSINRIHDTTSGYYENVIKKIVASSQENLDNFLKYEKIGSKVYKIVSLMWHNSSQRQKGATILNESTQVLYKKWLRHTVVRAIKSQQGKKFAFINASNEWAKGKHLEPCQKWASQYLRQPKML
jgi:hypothetical protein